MNPDTPEHAYGRATARVHVAKLEGEGFDVGYALGLVEELAQMDQPRMEQRVQELRQTLPRGK